MRHLFHYCFPLALAAATLAGPASAECNQTRCTGEIETLYVNAARVMISTTSDERKLNCRLEENRYIKLELNHPVFDELYAMLLTAKAGRLQTTLRIEEGSNGCRLVYALLK